MTTEPEQEKSPEAPSTDQETKPTETSTGMEPKVGGLLCYLAGWITGIIFLLIEKDNKFVRFHAVQSTVTFGAINVVWIILWFIPIVGWILNIFLWILAVVLWIVLMYKAYQEEEWKVPISGNIARDVAYKD
jgi:uncharacterized membrane protein